MIGNIIKLALVAIGGAYAQKQFNVCKHLEEVTGKGWNIAKTKFEEMTSSADEEVPSDVPQGEDNK